MEFVIISSRSTIFKMTVCFRNLQSLGIGKPITQTLVTKLIHQLCIELIIFYRCTIFYELTIRNQEAQITPATS